MPASLIFKEFKKEVGEGRKDSVEQQGDEEPLAASTPPGVQGSWAMSLNALLDALRGT